MIEIYSLASDVHMLTIQNDKYRKAIALALKERPIVSSSKRNKEPRKSKEDDIYENQCSSSSES